jgi:hypothetical protein
VHVRETLVMNVLFAINSTVVFMKLFLEKAFVEDSSFPFKTRENLIVRNNCSLLNIKKLFLLYTAVSEMQIHRKMMLPQIMKTSMLMAILLTASSVSTIFMYNAAYAQSSNTGFGNTTNLSLPNGKAIPINYLINTGKVLGVVLDKSRATLSVNISSPSAGDNGNLTIQIPRDVVDNKKEGNTDAPFRVHVDGKDATVRETANSKTTRTLSIQFNKDAKVIDIIGSKSTVQ